MNIKKPKKLLSIILTLCMVLSLLPMTALADNAPVVIGTTGYGTLTEALAAAANGDVIKLKDNIIEFVSYTVSADKTVTIDGGGFTLTGTAATDAALALSGAGTVILKDLTLQGGASTSGTSEGLDVSGSVSVQSYGTVTANGGAATTSCGLVNQGIGTVDVTTAAAIGGQWGYGIKNTSSGTVNVSTATGSSTGIMAAGVLNEAGGTVNVTEATGINGNGNGVYNTGSGTVNVTKAVSTSTIFGCGISNVSTGTVNAGTVTGALTGVNNISTGTVNAGTITGATQGTGINTGTAVTAIPLHVGTGASCVLDSITIANSGSTIGILPNVYKGSVCSTAWYTGIALANLFTMQEITGEATLYSSFYTIETAEDVAAYITEEVSGLTAGVSGSTVTVTGTATVTSTSDAALTIDIPAGVTVVWKASLTGGGSKYLLEPTGDGTFEITDGADIVNTACQVAIYCYDGKGILNVTGGKVSTTVGSGMAIGIAGDWLLTMTGGEVSANAADSCAIFGKNSVVITGGTVSATDASGYQLYMGDTSIYRSGVLDTGKIMYHDSGVFAEVCVDAAVTQAQPDTSTGLTAKGHDLSTGDSVSAVWAIQNGVSGVNISYYSANDATVAAEKWFLAVPGVTVTTTRTVTFNKNGGDTEASPMTKTVAPGGTVDALPTAPTRSGYTFTGWNTAADGSGAVFTASVIVKSDITLYAQWSKNSSTGSGGGGGGFSGGGSASGGGTTVSGSVINGTTGANVSNLTATVTTDSNGNYTVSLKAAQTVTFQQPDGTMSPLSDLSKVSYVSLGGSSVTVSADGTINLQNLSKGTDNQYKITYDLGNGQTLTLGTLEVIVSNDGTVSLKCTLIDPYGIITDAATGKPIDGAKVTLYYANTERNKTNGKTPDTVVSLPGIDGFKPNNNQNPQTSDTKGAYGFMVFPNTDYYIVASKEGYEQYTSPTISVGQDIVHWDFKMSTPITGVNRLAGQSRVDTALAIAKANYLGTLSSVVLATADNYPDALAGSVLAYKLNAPILLIGSSEADQAKVLDYMKSNLDLSGNVYILGGIAVVSADMEAKIKEDGFNQITRLGGTDRYETCVKIADQLQVKSGTPLVLAYGENYPDALSISSIAAEMQYPILLVQKDGISDAVKNEIAAIKPTKVYIIGGEGVISVTVESQVAQVTSLDKAKIVRIAGVDRYETSLAVAKYFNLSGQSVCIATGNNFPDALAGSVYASNHNAPIILADGNLSDQVMNYLKVKKLNGATLFGGEAVVSKDIEQQLGQLMGK